MGQRQQGFERGLITAVAAAFSSLGVYLDIGLGTRTVIIQIRIQIGTVELLDALGVGGRDMAPAHVFADDGSVLGFRQPIVVAMPGATFGLLDHQLVQQLGYGVVDELAAVIGVKAVQDKGKLSQQGGEDR